MKCGHMFIFLYGFHCLSGLSAFLKYSCLSGVAGGWICVFRLIQLEQENYSIFTFLQNG